LVSKPETGLGYQVVTFVLKDGRKFNQAIVQSGFITRARGFEEVPFNDDDIAEITVTHDKGDFHSET
jgi:hypothetical protein